MVSINLCLLFILSVLDGCSPFPFLEKKKKKEVYSLSSLEVLIVYQCKAWYMEGAHSLCLSVAGCLAPTVSFLRLSSFEIPVMDHLKQKYTISIAQGREPGLSQEETRLRLGRGEGVNKGLGRTTRNI